MEEVLAKRQMELEASFAREGTSPHILWATTFKDHRRSELLVPALQAFYAEPDMQPDHETEGFLIGLTAEILSQMSPEEAADASLRIMVQGIVPRDLMLGACRLSRGEANQAIYQQYADTLSKAADQTPDSVASKHVRNTLSRLERVPQGANLEDEILPHTEPDWVKPVSMAEEVVGGPVLSGGRAHALEAVPQLRQMLTAPSVGDAEADEAARSERIASAGGSTDDLVFWIMSSSAHFGMLSGAYSASGSLALLRRMADMAEPWGEASLLLREAGQSEVEAALLSDMSTPMPSALALEPSASVTSEINARHVRASVSRMVINHLVGSVQECPDILKVLSEECADLKDALPVTASTPKSAIHRLLVFPKALHLVSLALLKSYDDQVGRA